MAYCGVGKTCLSGSDNEGLAGFFVFIIRVIVLVVLSFLISRISGLEQVKSAGERCPTCDFINFIFLPMPAHLRDVFEMYCTGDMICHFFEREVRSMFIYALQSNLQEKMC